MIISPMQKDFKKFIGEQAVTVGCYIPSKYNYYIVDDDGAKLVYNTLTGMIAVLTDTQWELLHRENYELDLDHLEECSELIKYRFFVSKDTNEMMDYLELYNIVRNFMPSSAITSYTVLTTTGCNARCFYCFEQGFKPDTMRKSTAASLADYMIDHSKDNKISIHWFGGEPLCNTSAIDIICTRLKNANVRFSSTMTSNGYAFTKNLVATAANLWNLNHVQITLDGLHDEHNRRKNYICSSPDPFDQTITNIHELIGAGISVSVRLNFDFGNNSEMPALIDFLSEEFRGCKRISFYPVALFEDCNTWNPDRAPDEQLKLIQEQIRLSKNIRERGVLSEKNVCRGFAISHCGANNPAHRTINPNGTFSFCHNYSDSSVFGSIFDDILDVESFQKWTNNNRLRKKCSECIWLPECTAFDMCPVKKSFCQIDYENHVCNKIIRIYRSWKKSNE